MLGVLWGAATQSWFSYGYICAIAINTFYTAKKKKKKKEYANYLCNRTKSLIPLCLSGYDHSPIDKCPLFI